MTLPIFAGFVGADRVWHLITESSDSADALRSGAVWTPRLAALRGASGVQLGARSGEGVQYSAGVDFSPTSRVTRGASGFPPQEATPGSIGAAGYSPYVQLLDGTVVNAPIVAHRTGQLDRVLSIDTVRRVATVRMTRGYADGAVLWYISTDASDAGVAAMEGATFAPVLASIPSERSAPGSAARAGIVAVTNGETGATAPERQGLSSALLDGLPPLNVLDTYPPQSRSGTAYSPVWELHLVRWTDGAIAANRRERIWSWADARDALDAGRLVPAMRGAPNRTIAKLQGTGIIVNCPIVVPPTFAAAQRS
ncbi:MAG: hypothetical protein SFW08_05000 [Gemmatimonadaceae bacterium]|nr:hypothetical protein [Gemmatimonadaceae bacterium]